MNCLEGFCFFVLDYAGCPMRFIRNGKINRWQALFEFLGINDLRQRLVSCENNREPPPEFFRDFRACLTSPTIVSESVVAGDSISATYPVDASPASAWEHTTTVLISLFASLSHAWRD